MPTISPANSEFDFEVLVLEGFKNQHLEDELNLFSLSPFSSPDSFPPLPSISLPSSSSHSLPDPAPHPSSSSSNRTFIPRQAIPSRAKRQSRKNRKKKRQAAKCKEGVDETEMGQLRTDALKLHMLAVQQHLKPDLTAKQSWSQRQLDMLAFNNRPGKHYTSWKFSPALVRPLD